MIIPPINSKGLFKFAAPFSTLLPDNQVYTVKAIRMLSDLQDSGEKPFETIYDAVKMTKEDFDSDVKNNVPIITFATEGCEYFYIPASKVLSQPQPIGHMYQEKILAISLGAIPIDMNLSVVKDIIVEDVYNAVGIKSDIAEIDGSAKVLLAEEEHKTKMLLMQNTKTVDKSYKTRYLETLELLNKKEQALQELLSCIDSQNCCSN